MYLRTCVCVCLILSMYSCQLSAAAHWSDHWWWRRRGLHLCVPTHFNGCPPSEPHNAPKLNQSLPILLLQPVTACVGTSTCPNNKLCPPHQRYEFTDVASPDSANVLCTSAVNASCATTNSAAKKPKRCVSVSVRV